MSWIILFFMVATAALLIYIFNYIMRECLKVEKPKLFSYNHVNKSHKKIDWTIRIIFLVSFLLVLFYRPINFDVDEFIWQFVAVILIIGYLMVSEIVRAIMEWKYAENKKAYILTLSQLAFSLLLVGIILFINF